MSPPVDAGTLNGSILGPYSYIVTWLGTNPAAPTTYSGNTFVGYKENKLRSKNKRDHWGFIPPGQYQVFAAHVELLTFQYKDKIARYRGTCNLGGVGPADYRFWGTKVSGGMRVADTSSNLENAVLNKCLSKIRDNKFNYLADVAEAGKTIDLASKLIKTLFDAYKAMRRGDITAVVRILRQAKYGKSIFDNFAKYASNLWLGFIYGVKPLVSDIHEALKLVSNGLFSGNLEAESKSSQSYGLPSRPFDFVGGIWEPTGSCTVGVEVKIFARINSTTRSLLANLGVDNPFSLAWELLPYSFVVDWLIPVGSVLDNLATSVGIEFRGGYMNRKVTTNMEIQGLRPGNKPEALGRWPGFRFKNKGLYRSIYLSMPMPRLYVKSPFSSGHVINAVALIAQHAGR